MKQAVNPPPDGGYPGGNTAEGQHALLDLTTGTYNTAVGLYSLLSNTTGKFNTGVGAGTLLANTGSGNVCIGEGVSGEAGVDDSTYIRNVNMTEQSPADDVAFVTVRLSDGRLGHQPTVMRSASSELQKTVDELQATVAQLTRHVEEQAAQIQKVSARLAAASPSSRAGGGLEASKFATGRIRGGGAAPQVVNNP